MTAFQRPRSVRELITTNPALALLLAINIAVFVFMVLSGVSPMNPNIMDLYRFGGVSQRLLNIGEYWRLGASMFVHGGLAHLVMNLLALFISLTYLRGTLRAWMLIIIYLICGVAASLTSAYWYDNVLSVGASGAIAGFFGILLVWTFTRVFPEPANQQIRSQILAIIILTAVLGVTGLMGGNDVDNAAHAGGLFTGVIIAVLYRLFIKRW